MSIFFCTEMYWCSLIRVVFTSSTRYLRSMEKLQSKYVYGDNALLESQNISFLSQRISEKKFQWSVIVQIHSLKHEAT